MEETQGAFCRWIRARATTPPVPGMTACTMLVLVELRVYLYAAPSVNTMRPYVPMVPWYHRYHGTFKCTTYVRTVRAFALQLMFPFKTHAGCDINSSQHTS